MELCEEWDGSIIPVFVFPLFRSTLIIKNLSIVYIVSDMTRYDGEVDHDEEKDDGQEEEGGDP